MNRWLVPACVVVAALVVPAAPAQSRLAFSRTFDNLQIRFLSTQLTTSTATRAEWGFSAMIEADDARLLFDTGNLPDTVTSNAQVLKVNLQGVHDVTLSHWHGDHVGGVLSVLKAVGAGDTRIYTHPRIFEEKFARNAPGTQLNTLRNRRTDIEAQHGVFDLSAEPREIRPGFALTGSVPRTRLTDQKLPEGTLMRAGEQLVVDNVPDEQSLIINTRDGLVVVTGCGHAGVVNTVDHVRRLFPDRRVAAVVGGLHWYASRESDIVEAGRELRSLGVSRLIGAHCTLVEPMFTLRQHGWSRDQAAIGALGDDFFLRKPGAAAASRAADAQPLAVASAHQETSSCHGSF